MSDINIAFMGDIMPGGMFVGQNGVRREVLSYLAAFDFRIATLETAFGDGSNLCHLKNRPELGTIIFSPDESIQMLIDMGINAVSLANNHSCDCDLVGLYHTMELLDKNGIVHFGAGHNKAEAAKPVILEKYGKTICLLGYLQEYKYLYRGEGYIPTETDGGINIYQIENVLSDVRKNKALYDYVFVLPHWGKEGSVFPRSEEIKDAKRIIEAGADGVIGSHSHIVQPVARYKEGIIAMNLGNFAFPDRYISPPRISYYPKNNKIGGSVPVVESFHIVKTISYKRVASRERFGLVLGMLLNERNLGIKEYYTLLSDDNCVEQRTFISFSYRIIYYYVLLLIKNDVLRKLHLRFVGAIKRIKLNVFQIKKFYF